MFFNVAALGRPFPWIARLTENATVFAADAVALDAFAPWRETHVYRGSWSVAPLFNGYQRAHGEWNSLVEKACGRSAALLRSVPDLLSAGFSRLAPGCRILPHRGCDPMVLRVHLGLLTPERCGLNVGGMVRAWSHGECLAFDDTVVHEAWNFSDSPRVVLLLDVKLPRPAMALLGDFAELRAPMDHARLLSLTARYAARLGRRHVLRITRDLTR